MDRAYMAALRSSTMSLYEVSDIQPGQSFLARDLLRGGEPIHVTEHTATKTIKPWDRLAMRIVEVRSKTVIGGGLLPFEHQLADKMIGTFAGTKKRITKDAPAFFDELGLDAGDPEVDRLITSATSDSELLRASAPLFSTLFLVDLLDRVLDPKLPQLANSDGEEMEFIALVYRLKDAADTGEGSSGPRSSARPRCGLADVLELAGAKGRRAEAEPTEKGQGARLHVDHG